MKYIPDMQPGPMDKKIANAQAWNLAVEMYGIQSKEGGLEAWHEYFFTKLWEEPLAAWKEHQAGLAKGKDVGRDDAIEDINQELPL